MYSVGICMGTSTVKVVKLKNKDGRPAVEEAIVRSHEGQVKETLKNILNKKTFDDCHRYGVTGRKFKDLVDLPTISEPKATELAYKFVSGDNSNIEAIISGGGETFMVYELNKLGNISNVYTGNKCASGTGEFYFQQLKRMGVTPEETKKIARLDDPYEVSGRCSVFCKSDCTHALNKGEDKGRIVAGLSKMMVNRIGEQLSKCGASRVFLVGGTAKNKIMLKDLRKRVRELQVPEEAVYFEALGAALWGLKNGRDYRSSNLFVQNSSSFNFMEPLVNYKDKVKFHSIERSSIAKNDECILGVDVGSTTTKAVLIKEKDDSLVASIYLRTEGDPVGAARKCYSQLEDQVKNKNIQITGLGVTGSGRHIVGLHALTDSVINEIIAHAKASVHFDEEVNTIFEIGGQDAKYTYLVNGVPTDYAMNEACAAGTGSFLEESAYEVLNVEMEDIAGHALNGKNPPNFSDQCSAFISSDIKTAIQEGISVDDICAGLVYSICRNYTNRVKENRPVGDKVFMQGGVCYNKAVPMAMAALTGKDIIVPPEPGLMGAFGVALAVKENIKLGLTEKSTFELHRLADREVTYHEPFICRGGIEKCDRKCEINVLEIDGKKYPFGGICDKYYNRGNEQEIDVRNLDMVRKREKLVFEDYFYQPQKPGPDSKKIGINRSLSVNTLLPLFSRFFGELGHQIVLPDKSAEEGKQRQASSFCHPVEISHGYMYDLLNNHSTDYIFLPQIKGLPVKGYENRAVLCPLSQGEPYYLQAIWPKLKNDNVFTPVLNFQDGYSAAKEEFVQIGKELGHKRSTVIQAYNKAVKHQQNFRQICRDTGREILDDLEKDPRRKAIVIFGRSYNALTSVANMGIPHKFASRGELVIPFDMLPIEEKEPDDGMYWALGQQIIRGAKYVSEHPQLYATYITNFSCGPDSFLLGYFRRINGRKPTLTLELDSHTADAGIDTRIEAFLDVVASYRKLNKDSFKEKDDSNYQPARINLDGEEIAVVDSSGKKHLLTDDSVKVLVPSMGKKITRASVAALNYYGISAKACKPPAQPELKAGQSTCTGKECLPLQLTMGSLINYYENKKKDGQILVYFMPRSSGPCRFGQYNIFMNNFIRDNNLEDVAVLTLSDDNNYGDMGHRFTLRAWQSLITGDVLSDIYNTIRVLAVDKEKAKATYEKSSDRIFKALSQSSWFKIKKILRKEAKRLSKIELSRPVAEVPKVSLVGEIYVRQDEFSRNYMVKKLADRGIMTRVTPMHEWLYYVDYLALHGEEFSDYSLTEKLKHKLISKVKKHFEKTIKNILGKSGLYNGHLIDIQKVIDATDGLFSPELTGEAILTIGTALTDIVDSVDGAIAIGPFGCMPNRLSEAILSESIKTQKKNIESENHPVHNLIDDLSMLPFLAIETDGNVLSQEVEARLEAFCLQVKRICNYQNTDDNQNLNAGKKLEELIQINS
ncbi:MAG: acyl-CoA dehydratase activase [Elusimicrobiota bacterium]